MSYAQTTTVSVAKSKAEIEDLITRYGADQFATLTESHRAVILFAVMGRRVKFVLNIPAKDDKRFTHRKSRYSWKAPEKLTDVQALALWEQECRRLWRCLLIVIKAKLEACSSGIVTFESEFLSHFIQPNGRTVGEDIGPQVLAMHESGKHVPLLLEGARFLEAK